MANVLIHTLVFSPDGVSTAYLMTDLARQLKGSGHSVQVLTTTPHYNLDEKTLRRQPLRKRWFGLLYASECDGIAVCHVKIPMKGQRVYSRLLDHMYFHVMALIVGTFVLERYDLVITPSPPVTMGVVGWLLGLRRRAAVIYNIQELFTDALINHGLIRNPIMIRLLRRVEKFVHDHSTMLVPISDWFGRKIRERGVPGEKIRVIPNFVDLDIYHPMERRNEFAEENRLLDGFVVLYGGNIGLNNDWESFLFAAASLRSLPIQFVVVGDGGRSKWLRQEIERRSLVNVRLLGYRSRNLMPIINASSDVCTIPMKATTSSDTFPSKIYTIMACGKPVIVSADADSELRWLIEEARCGTVVPPDDPEAYTAAVRNAYDNKETLAATGERGRQFVELVYSKEVVGRKYHELIQELMVGRQSIPPMGIPRSVR